MDRDRFKALLKAVPFEPFTIHVDDGDLIGIRSPEYVWLPPIGSTIYVIRQSGEGDEMRILGLQHVSQVTVGPGESIQFPIA